MRDELIRNAVPGAIVLGGNFVALGVVRSLAAHGIPVWVIDDDKNTSIARFSRHTKRFIETREPVTELLLREGREHGLNGWVLFPVGDQYVETLAADRELLSSIYRVTTPPLRVVNFALDKRLTYQKAEELGIAAPWTTVARSLDDLLEQALPYPVILKPALNHHFFPRTNVKALPIESAADLPSRYEQMLKYIPADEIMVQERIPGGGESQFSYCAACNNGQVYVSLVAQRRRQYPIEFGNASSFVETAKLPMVEAAGRTFLEGIGFDGIGEVEFKFDCRDGKYKILDVNPRAWGWHTLGKRAGVDFTYLLWRKSIGLEVARSEVQRNAAWLREITDVIAVFKSTKPFAEVHNILALVWRRELELATFKVLDPIPFFAELLLFVFSGASRQKRAQDFRRMKTPVIERDAVVSSNPRTL